MAEYWDTPTHYIDSSQLSVTIEPLEVWDPDFVKAEDCLQPCYIRLKFYNIYTLRNLEGAHISLFYKLSGVDVPSLRERVQAFLWSLPLAWAFALQLTRFGGGWHFGVDTQCPFFCDVLLPLWRVLSPEKHFRDDMCEFHTLSNCHITWHCPSHFSEF